MCFNCGKDGHIARFCHEYRGYGQAYNNQHRAQNTEENHASSTQPQGQASVQGPRITEVPDIPSIEVLSSAVGGMKVVREWVKYVEPAEVYASEWCSQRGGAGQRFVAPLLPRPGSWHTIRALPRPAG